MSSASAALIEEREVGALLCSTTRGEDAQVGGELGGKRAGAVELQVGYGGPVAHEASRCGLTEREKSTVEKTSLGK